jgi:hypothetical protein
MEELRKVRKQTSPSNILNEAFDSFRSSLDYADNARTTQAAYQSCGLKTLC